MILQLYKNETKVRKDGLSLFVSVRELIEKGYIRTTPNRTNH